ncbi:DUF5688 family protein [Butyrivibrio sp. FCS006]|uniref:DUF5688 family protein n=1 Tax=Butyrivibrio sp. FCS006 TaxID=1280684 RepID=UPI00040F7A90|nr:DUF5688 family protein [Butyrivibrio sp. FCS006]
MENKYAFDDFCNTVMQIIEKLAADSGNEISCVIQPVIKRNDISRTALHIESESNKSYPVVYLEDYYEMLQKSSVEEIAIQIYQTLGENLVVLSELEVQKLIERGSVEKFLTYRLINKEMNTDYLKDKVYRDFLDLAVVYEIGCSVGDNCGAIIVTKKLAEIIGYTENELYKIASANTPRKRPAKFMRLNEAIGIDNVERDFNDPFIVLSNNEKVFGASVILYPGLDKVIYDLYGESLIIPSSVHELLIINSDICADQLATMVNEVNNTVVNREDILSYSIYKVSEDGISLLETCVA